jgi:hypothetical protein
MHGKGSFGFEDGELARHAEIEQNLEDKPQAKSGP